MGSQRTRTRNLQVNAEEEVGVRKFMGITCLRVKFIKKFGKLNSTLTESNTFKVRKITQKRNTLGKFHDKIKIISNFKGTIRKKYNTYLERKNQNI